MPNRGKNYQGSAKLIDRNKLYEPAEAVTVSYTHLTLPTIYTV